VLSFHPCLSHRWQFISPLLPLSPFGAIYLRMAIAPGSSPSSSPTSLQRDQTGPAYPLRPTDGEDDAKERHPLPCSSAQRNWISALRGQPEKRGDEQE